MSRFVQDAVGSELRMLRPGSKWLQLTGIHLRYTALPSLRPSPCGPFNKLYAPLPNTLSCPWVTFAYH